MTNKYFELAKKTTIDYIEGQISAVEFKETFQKLDKIDIYQDLEKNGYIGISNYISAVAEIDDQSTLESQWIIDIIDLFYSYFTDNYGYIYAKDFYKFLKLGLSKKNKSPVRISFKKAIQNYLDKKISGECLAYISGEFLNSLGFFEKEIKEDKELLDILRIATKIKINRILEDLTPKEKKLKLEIDGKLKKFLTF